MFSSWSSTFFKCNFIRLDIPESFACAGAIILLWNRCLHHWHDDIYHSLQLVYNFPMIGNPGVYWRPGIYPWPGVIIVKCNKLRSRHCRRRSMHQYSLSTSHAPYWSCSYTSIDKIITGNTSNINRVCSVSQRTYIITKDYSFRSVHHVLLIYAQLSRAFNPVADPGDRGAMPQMAAKSSVFCLYNR